MPHPVVHWEMGCKDYPKAKAFYSNLFGWTINDDNPMKYGLVEKGGPEGIGGGMFPASDKFPPGLTFYVEVDDLQKYLDKAVSLGAKALVPPTVISPEIGSFAMFADPNGLCIGIYKTAPK